MLAAPKRPGSIRVLACGVRRLAEQSFPAGRRKLHAGTRALPDLPETVAPLRFPEMISERCFRRDVESIGYHGA
jgi:hypothetical protein